MSELERLSGLAEQQAAYVQRLEKELRQHAAWWRAEARGIRDRAESRARAYEMCAAQAEEAVVGASPVEVNDE